MTVEIRHAFVSPKADGADATKVRPSNWNSNHQITANSGSVLGTRVGQTTVTELPIAVDGSGNVTVTSSSPVNSPFLTLQNTDSSASNSFGPSVVFRSGVPGAKGFVISQMKSSGAPLRISDPSAPFTVYASIEQSGSIIIGSTNVDVWNGVNGTGTIISADGSIAVHRANNPCAVFGRQGSNGTAVVFYREGAAVGNVSVTGTGTAYNTSSDYRLKSNVTPMTNRLAAVMTLNPVTYTWNTDSSSGQGFLAHELQAVIPDAVTGEKDAEDADGNPVYQGVDFSRVVPTLVAAIQEQQAQIAALTVRIEALENAA